jgi:chromosome segregation ATPase
MEVKASAQRNLMQYHAQLRELRTVHLEDAATREELYEMIDELKQHVSRAAVDLQSAGQQRPQIQSLTEHVLSQINEKHAFLNEAETLISSCMKDEVDTRERMLDLAEEILEEDELSSSQARSLERDISRYRSKLFDADSVVKIDQALRSLRNSMNVSVDLGNIIRAAEGNPLTASAE